MKVNIRILTLAVSCATGMLCAAEDPANTLRYNFESGDLDGWIVSEGSFGMLVSDLANARHGSGPYPREGNYHLSTVDLLGGGFSDGMTGVVISPVFTLLDPAVSFWVGGGSSANTNVSLVRIDEDLNETVVLTESGANSETMRVITADLTAEVGNDLFIRVTDNSTSGWGHVTFDNFLAQAEVNDALTGALFGDPFASAIQSLESALADIEAKHPDFDGSDLLDELANLSPATTTEELDDLERRVLLSNPDFDDEILFIVRKQFPRDHQNSENWYPKNETNSNQYNASFYGGSYIKKLNVRTGTVTNLLYAGSQGVFRDLDIHFDGKKFLFAWRKNYADEFHIYEMKVDGTGLRQLTSDPGHNGFVVFDGSPIYLADDSIAFVSSREPKHIPCNKHRGANMYRMDHDGANIHRISNNLLHDNNLSLGPDGKIYYDRWEYLDRDFGSAQGIWSCNPDGTGHMLVYGNNSYGGAFIDARWIPGTQKFLAILGSCHDQAWGPLVLVDNRLGFNINSTDTRSILKVWPPDTESYLGLSSHDNETFINETRFSYPYPGSIPGIDATLDNASTRYEDPYPVTENTFLVTRSTGNVLANDLQTGLYLVDTFGNEIQVYAEPSDPSRKLGCYDPVFIRPRERPIVIPNKRHYDNRDGSYYIENVHKGTHMGPVSEGEVKYVRVVETGEKRNWVSYHWQAQGFQAPVMNLGPFENRRILGDVAVEDDGSAFFNVPADKLVYFQLLDEDKKMLHSMRSYITVQPGEVMGCVGCHDPRNAAPEAYDGISLLDALSREPKDLEPFLYEEGEDPEFFGFYEQVQPILNAKCMSCHDFPGTGNDSGSDAVILAPDTEFAFNAAYISIHQKHLSANIGGAGPEIFPAKSWGSHQSKLIQKLETGHGGLTAEELEIMQAWVDLNSPYYPDYHTAHSSKPFGRSPLTRGELDALLSNTGYNLNTIRTTTRAVATGPLISYERPELSPILNGLNQSAVNNVVNYLNTGKQRLTANPQMGMPGFTRDSSSQDREDFYHVQWAKELAAREAIVNGTKIYDPGITPADTTPARITLTGSDPLLLTVNDTTIPEPGYAAIDAADGDITEAVVRDTSAVSLGVPGVYEMSYAVTDHAGNETLPVVRTVIVSSVPAGAYAGEAFIPRDAIVSPDQTTAYITGKYSSLLLVVDLTSGAQNQSIDYGYNLTGIAIGADEIYLTTDDPRAAVLILDRTTLQQIAMIPGGHGAHAPVLSADGATLYVCNQWSKSVSIFDLAGRMTLATIPVSGQASAAVLSTDEQRLYVSNFLPVAASSGDNDSAKINVINLTSRTVTGQIALPNGSHSLYDLALSPDGNYLLGVHTLGKIQLATNQLDKGWQNTARLAVVRLSDHKLMSDFMLDDLNKGAANPRGLAVNGNTLAISHSGSHELTLLDYSKLSQILTTIDPDDIAARRTRDADYSLLVDGRVRVPLKVPVADVLDRPVVGMGPSKVLPVGDDFLVLESFTDSISVINPHISGIEQRILLNLSTDADPVHQGFIAFRNAEHAMHTWQACTSCHPGGRSDGLKWDTLGDGYGNPKNSKNLVLSHLTAPVLSMGGIKDTEADIPIGQTGLMNTVRPQAENDNIYAYLRSLKPVPSPHLENKILSESARRGKALFTQANCAACHSGALFTDQKMYDVGTGTGKDAGEAFDTPALIELWRSAPYLSDGSAPDLVSLLATHAGGPSLSYAERSDLAEYLLSLPEIEVELEEVAGTDFGFELPDLAAGTEEAIPAGSPWDFEGTAGVCSNGSGLGLSDAPQGEQAAFIRQNGSFQQSIAIPEDGYYRIILQGSQAVGSSQSVSIRLNGSEVMAFTPSTTEWKQFITSDLLLKAGNYSLRFEGSGFGAATDVAFIDDVLIQQSNIYNYAAWAIENGIISGVNGDDDQDGVVNLLDYAFGGDPAGRDSELLPRMNLSGTNFSISFEKAAKDLTYVVEYSYDLSKWHRDPEAIFPPGENDLGEQTVEFVVPEEKQFFVRVVVD